MMLERRSGLDDTGRCGIHIVMATYNGAAYLEEQIESIRAQSLVEWLLWIRDDGSDDGTLEIIRRYQQIDRRIVVVEDDQRNLGPSGNFSLLLRHALDAGAAYVFLSDQDDVWHSDKMAEQLALMRSAESGGERPVAVYSDLEVVDSQLHRIHRSFMRYEMLRPESDPLQVLLVQNFVTGCTLLVNRALLHYALPVPSRVMMHDWWLALCAASFGELHFLPRTTVRYRQHGNNQVGAQGYWRRAFPLMTIFGRRRRGVRLGDFVRSVCQAQSLDRRLRDAGSGQVSEVKMALVSGYCDLFDRTICARQRVRGIFSLGIHRQGIPRNLFLIMQTVLWARKSKQMRSAQTDGVC